MSRNEFTISLEGMNAAEINEVAKAIETGCNSTNDRAIDFLYDYLGENATRLLAEALTQNQPEAAEILHDLFDDEEPGWDNAVQTVYKWRENACKNAPEQDWALEEAAKQANKGGNVYARGRFAGMAVMAAQAIPTDGPDEAEEIVKAFHEIYGVAYVEM